jgi:LysM repeat protein
LAVGDKVKRGDKLLVLGIRLYVVDVNDYLGRIAKVNGVSETALKRANPHYNWSKMYYGDTVIIPAH